MSGLQILYFICLAYWITNCIKDKKVLVLGLIALIMTGVNPYGYKLLIFNLLHNSNINMKEILNDWKCIDAKTELGLICTIALLIIVVAIYRVDYKKLELNQFYITYLCAVLYLVLQSARHLIYLLPVGGDYVK